MYRTYIAPLLALANLIAVSSVLALPFGDLSWGKSLSELKQFSEKNKMNCIAEEKFSVIDVIPTSLGKQLN